MIFNKNKRSEEPLVSIVIPSYNHEKYIRECVDSVLNQTYKNFELIIIDDGSTDGTKSILDSYSDTRLKIVYQENCGAHNTINKGCNMAKGEFISILNSDDAYHKDRIRILVDEIMKNSGISIITSYITVVDGSSKELGVKKAWKNMLPWNIENIHKTYIGKNDPNKNLIMTNYISTTSNMLFRKSLFDELKGMRNLRFAHDWDFALRALNHGNIFVVEKPLMSYRIHSSNTISSNRKHMLFEICWIFAANNDILALNAISSDDYTDEIGLLCESMNFQGNDKLVWLLITYFKVLKNKGVKEPELLFLENNELRESLYKFINE